MRERDQLLYTLTLSRQLTLNTRSSTTVNNHNKGLGAERATNKPVRSPVMSTSTGFIIERAPHTHSAWLKWRARGWKTLKCPIVDWNLDQVDRYHRTSFFLKVLC